MEHLGSSFKCNTQGPWGIGCCDGQTIQAPRQRGPWRDFGGASARGEPAGHLRVIGRIVQSPPRQLAPPGTERTNGRRTAWHSLDTGQRPCVTPSQAASSPCHAIFAGRFPGVRGQNGATKIAVDNISYLTGKYGMRPFYEQHLAILAERWACRVAQYSSAFFKE